MPPRFIGKTSLAGLHLVRLGGQPVLGMYARLRHLLQSRAGLPAADLFAEPVVAWPDGDSPGSISWYAGATGDGEPLAALPPDRRAGVEVRLRDIVRQISPLCADPELGPLLRRAVALGSPDGLLAVDGIPVLTAWGLAADDIGTEEEVTARASAWLASYATSSASAAPIAALAPSPPTLKPETARALPATAVTPGGAWDWSLVPAAIVAATLFLVFGIYLGTRMVSARLTERPNAAVLLNEQATREAMDRQRGQNVALENEIESRRRLLTGNVCVRDSAQMPRVGPDRTSPVMPAAVVPPRPGAQPFQGTLADLLTQAVVLIVAPGRGADGETATGSGFFATPDLIVTNRHVIENADPARIVVTSRKLGRITRAQIVAQTPNSEVGSPDIAILRVEGTVGIQPLAFSTTTAPLQEVIAAGFPGLVMQADEAFDRLRRGDATAVPEVILTDGRVNAIQSAAGGMKIIPHSAAVSGGNSGGPLADACGRVIGINTFITANREQVVHANYAQKSDGVVAFMRQNGANVADLTGPCTPAVPPATQAAGSPVTPPAAPAAASAPR